MAVLLRHSQALERTRGCAESGRKHRVFAPGTI